MMATQSNIFTGLYLEDSYLLGIVVRGKELRLHAMFALTGDHPAYVPPMVGEQHCYREGELRWEDVAVISSFGLPHAAVLADPDGTLDLGSIAYSLDNDVHHIAAEWIDIRFTAKKGEAVLVS